MNLCLPVTCALCRFCGASRCLFVGDPTDWVIDLPNTASELPTGLIVTRRDPSLARTTRRHNSVAGGILDIARVWWHNQTWTGQRWERDLIKRLFDIVVATSVLLVFAPVIAVVAVLVRRRMGSPVLFRQTRPGLDGKPFAMIKFRTMTNERDGEGQLLPDADRLPALGVFLRSSSLDELPGLWNVIKGEMSLVGPRPLLMDYLPLYSPAQARRHEVRPGITGWAQVNGRNALNWDQKFAHDVWYVDNQSLWLDIRILFMTVRKVLIRDGISAEGEATMSRFEGNS
jgi:lipopolysaccharide/colanic/teichoic acid biosynthesis glycosyltransferase